MVSLLWKACRSIAADARRVAFFALMMVFGIVIAPVVALATDPVSLPNTGVDMEGTVDALVTGLGGVILKIVLAFAAYLLIKFGMKWFRRLA